MTKRGLAVAAAIALVATPALAQHWRTLDASRQLKDSGMVEVRVKYAAGKLELRPTSASGSLYSMSLKYDAERSEPLANYDTDRRTLDLGLKGVRGNWKSSDEDGAAMHAELSTIVPLELSVEVGAVEGDLQLGGLRLTALNLKSGAAEMTARWDQPNRERMRLLSVDVGAASTKLVRAGNAHADRIKANVGVGGLELDLGGEWTRDIAISANVAMGKFTLRVPPDVGVMIESSAFLVDFDKSAFRKRGNDWYSNDYDAAPRKVRLELHGAFGGVSITRDAK